MELDLRYSQKQYHSEGTRMESLRQEIKGKTKRKSEQSQRERCGKEWTEIKRLALDREEWEKFVSGLYPVKESKRL